MAALSLLELLVGAFNGSQVLIADLRGNRFNSTLSSESLLEVQAFFNAQLQLTQSHGFSCSFPDPTLFGKQVPELLILVGALCAGSDDLLQPFVREGGQVLYLRQYQRGALPGFISYIDLGSQVSGFAQPTCNFVKSWLKRRRGDADCIHDIHDGEISFEPLEIRAFQRSMLKFQNLCPIRACCIGQQCSDLTDADEDAAMCWTPLLEMGIYNVTVTFWDVKDGNLGTLRLNVSLNVAAPKSTLQADRPERFESNPSTLAQAVLPELLPWYASRDEAYNTGSFSSLYDHSMSRCCDHVAVATDLAIMGRLDRDYAPTCSQNFDRSQHETPAPIQHERPFPTTLRFVALRCYVKSTQVEADGPDGASCNLPSLPSLEPPPLALAEEEHTWIWQQKVDSYVRAAEQHVEQHVNNAEPLDPLASGPKRAQWIVRQALKATGLQSRFQYRTLKGCDEDPERERFVSIITPAYIGYIIRPSRGSAFERASLF